MNVLKKCGLMQRNGIRGRKMESPTIEGLRRWYMDPNFGERMIPEVQKILDRITEIHQRKNQDYASQGKPFENFERSSEIISWFNKPVDQAFVALIATKLARLAVLKSQEAKPQNESLEDSLLDLSVYCILWYAHYLHSTQPFDDQPRVCCFQCADRVEPPITADDLGRVFCPRHQHLAAQLPQSIPSRVK
jgi:hypothetical protein